MNNQEDGNRYRQALVEIVRLLKEREREAEVEKEVSYRGDHSLYVRGKTLQRYSLSLRELIKRTAPQDIVVLLDRHRDGS